MTVETTNRFQNFAGGQSVLTFNFRTLLSNPEYVQVNAVAVTGSTIALVYNVDYTVVVNSDGVGGTVTVLPSYGTNYNYVVYRQTAPLQDSAYTDYNQFPAATLENNLDQLTMVAQENSEDSTRTLQFQVGTVIGSTSTVLPNPLANAFIGWDPTGTFLTNLELPNPSTLVKASTAVAQAGTDDTDYMTALKVKQEVQNPGTVAIPVSNISGLVTTSTTQIQQAIYPVGSLYFSALVSTSPAVVLGFGTWLQIAGYAIVGFKSGDANFGSTGVVSAGEAQHTLTIPEMPSHTHTYTAPSGGSTVANGGFSNSDPSASTGSTGGGSPHNNIQPSFVVYCWYRSA